jgi:hypothetical protein
VIRSIELLPDERGVILHLFSGDRVTYERRSNGFYWTGHGNTSADRLDVTRGAPAGYFDGVAAMFHAMNRFRAQMMEEVEKLREEVREQDRRNFQMHSDMIERLYRQVSLGRHGQLNHWREQNPTPEGTVPDCLKDVRHIKRIEIEYPCYVYFLLHESAVVYVGRTTSPWPLRVLQHVEEGVKQFDDVWCVECDRQSVTRVEAAYIRRFRPKYNVANNRQEVAL